MADAEVAEKVDFVIPNVTLGDPSRTISDLLSFVGDDIETSTDGSLNITTKYGVRAKRGGPVFTEAPVSTGFQFRGSGSAAAGRMPRSRLRNPTED